MNDIKGLLGLGLLGLGLFRSLRFCATNLLLAVASAQRRLLLPTHWDCIQGQRHLRDPTS